MENNIEPEDKNKVKNKIDPLTKKKYNKKYYNKNHENIVLNQRKRYYENMNIITENIKKDLENLNKEELINIFDKMLVKHYGLILYYIDMIKN